MSQPVTATHYREQCQNLHKPFWLSSVNDWFRRAQSSHLHLMGATSTFAPRTGITLSVGRRTWMRVKKWVEMRRLQWSQTWEGTEQATIGSETLEQSSAPLLMHQSHGLLLSKSLQTKKSTWKHWTYPVGRHRPQGGRPQWECDGDCQECPSHLVHKSCRLTPACPNLTASLGRPGAVGGPVSQKVIHTASEE